MAKLQMHSMDVGITAIMMAAVLMMPVDAPATTAYTIRQRQTRRMRSKEASPLQLAYRRTALSPGFDGHTMVWMARLAHGR
ncbi:hypothetical protein [Thauera sp.]|uniref:hypothetical protein n=1 Tax=Thauera sp. TaxID=1905334 RepID=UPI0039E50B36